MSASKQFQEPPFLFVFMFTKLADLVLRGIHHPVNFVIVTKIIKMYSGLVSY